MPNSNFHELYTALICGAPITNGAHRQLFIDTGLLHLLIVSGAHLHFLERWMSPFSSRVRLTILGLYCWICSFGAPVVRAWARRVIGLTGRSTFASGLQFEFVTILVIVLLYPPWLFSRSFMMSWLCGLALSLPPVIINRTISQCAYCYLFLLLFCPNSPSTLLVNILIAPLVGALLFPLCLLVALCPWLTPVGDFFWKILLVVLQHCPESQPAPWVLSGRWLFLFPLTLHLVLLLLEVPCRRARWSSC